MWLNCLLRSLTSCSSSPLYHVSPVQDVLIQTMCRDAPHSALILGILVLFLWVFLFFLAFPLHDVMSALSAGMIFLLSLPNTICGLSQVAVTAGMNEM